MITSFKVCQAKNTVGTCILPPLQIDWEIPSKLTFFRRCGPARDIRTTPRGAQMIMENSAVTRIWSPQSMYSCPFPSSCNSKGMGNFTAWEISQSRPKIMQFPFLSAPVHQALFEENRWKHIHPHAVPARALPRAHSLPIRSKKDDALQ